jgi:predicted amidophosphoribosyltransferase
MSEDVHRDALPPQQPNDTAPLRQLEAWHELLRECQECQREVDLHWQFCAHCGTRLATKCPGCGNPLPPAGALSCPSCGLAIPQEQG